MDYIKLKDLTLSTQYGYTAEETSKTEGKYKYLRITDIVPYFVDFDTVPYCAIPENKVDQYLVHEGDVLIARTGATTGYNYVVSNNVENTVYASYLIRFNLDKSKILPSYVKYVLKSQSYYGFVNNYIGGSAQPGMNARVFGKFNVPYNSLSVQSRIASILSTYDNLIENNNKRIRLLEQMAENLYKEWFVRFRFPGHEKTEYENGLPKGWRVEKVQDWCKVFTGKKDVNQTVADGDYAFFSCSPNFFYSNEYIYDGKAILVAGNGSYTGRTRFYEGKFDLYQRTYAIVSKKSDAQFLYYLYTRFKFDFEKIYSGGTRGSAIPYIVMKDISRYKFLYEESIVNKFISIIKPMFKQIDDLNNENDILSRQRDLLLPRLMSGKLEVK